MRNGQQHQHQNKQRMRGRNRKTHNPMSRVYESNGPDVKIRGTPSHVAEKYVQLARDAQASGDPVSAENYYQHAEHYFRLIAAAQEQFRQTNPQFYRPDNEARNDTHSEMRDDSFDDDGGDDMEQQPMAGASEPAFGTRDPQPFLPPDAQPFPARDRDRQQPFPAREAQHNTAPQPVHQPASNEGGDVERLPSFITGGQQGQNPRPQQSPQNLQGNPGHGGNGHENQGDRFPLHRRRRRHRSGPRGDFQGAPQQGGDDRDEPTPRGE
jgi:hypothetical protein